MKTDCEFRKKKALAYFSFGSVCFGRVTSPSVMPYWLPSLAEHITVEYDIPRMGKKPKWGLIFS